MKRPIALVGMMGAGKSSVARLLGERLGVPVADVDALIEAEEDCTIAELFERRGEPAFRRLEGAALERALASGAGVIACGGGIVLEAAHRALLASRCVTVWLEVSAAEAARRLGEDGTSRPLLHGRPPAERLEALLEQRRSLYAEVAAIRVTTDALSPAEIAGRILSRLEASAR